LVIGYWLLVIGYWLLVVGYWLLVVGYFWCAFPCAFRRRGVAPVVGYWAGKPRPYTPIADCRLPKKLMRRLLMTDY